MRDGWRECDRDIGRQIPTRQKMGAAHRVVIHGTGMLLLLFRYDHTYENHNLEWWLWELHRQPDNPEKLTELVEIHVETHDPEPPPFTWAETVIDIEARSTNQ